MRASLSGLPNGGTVSDDVTPLEKKFTWQPGNIQETTADLTLTVSSLDGNIDTAVCRIGIDRSGPQIQNPAISPNEGWVPNSLITWTSLDASVVEVGSGLQQLEIQVGGDQNWQVIGTSGNAPLPESAVEVGFRATDHAGNVGPTYQVDLLVDRTDPISGLWRIIDEIHGSRIGPVQVSLSARDDGAGVDEMNSTIEYRFDADGIDAGESGWISVSGETLTRNIGPTIWRTHVGEYLALRATILDKAGNSIQTTPSFWPVPPGLDLSWENASVDRLAVIPGSKVSVHARLVTSEAFFDSVIIRVETAPADRDASANWTLGGNFYSQPGNLSDGIEDVLVEILIPSSGRYDIRLVIDSGKEIDERDEGNNIIHTAVTGINTEIVGVVPSFFPSMIMILVIGILTGLVNHSNFKDGRKER